MWQRLFSGKQFEYTFENSLWRKIAYELHKIHLTIFRPNTCQNMAKYGIWVTKLSQTPTSTSATENFESVPSSARPKEKYGCLDFNIYFDLWPTAAPTNFELWNLGWGGVVHNCTIFLCSLDVRNIWSMQRSKYKGERSSCWVTNYPNGYHR